MRFGFAPPPPPLAINLAADDTEDEQEELDEDLEPPRRLVLPRAGAAQQRARPRPKSRKRSLEQASRGASSSDDSGAEAAAAPASSSSSALALGHEDSGRGASFLTPSPVRIARQKKRGLHFFMDAGSRQRALLQGTSADSDPASVCAARALVCGQRFGRCHVRFVADQVELLLWKPTGAGAETRVWQGAVKYGQLARFCLSSGERAPYLLLLEIAAQAKGYTPFAQFFDPLFARWSQDHADCSDTQLYGAVLVLDEELDYARCRSIGDSIAELRGLFQSTIPEAEAQRYHELDQRRDRESDRRGWRQETLAANGGDAAAKSATSYPERAPAATAQPSQQQQQQESIAEDASRTVGPTVNLNDEEESEDKTADAPTVIVLQTQDSMSSNDANGAQKEAAADPCHQVALLYPFDDGSEALGRVSVTFGDLKRLAPGEFLNDNLIDFYLRFLWRHCEPWQQQQMYIFSSYFFTQLKPPREKKLTAQERYARVARWTQKVTDLFDKRFLFIPINDSFHWSIAVFCNPGSAVITKRRRRNSRREPNGSITDASASADVIELGGDPFGYFRAKGSEIAANIATGFFSKPVREAPASETSEKAVEYIEEELEESRSRRREYPPCVLFLDSLRCHRKKKFSTMLREYLECEWNARHPPPSDAEVKPEAAAPAGPDGTIDQPATVDDDDDDEEDADDETIVTSFDVDSIGLIEPDIPRQTNSSDCGVFLLMYAAEVARRFPVGATREDFEANLSTALTPDMFDAEHVREFREYLHQLIFSLRALQRRGLGEALIKAEQLEWFTVDA